MNSHPFTKFTLVSQRGFYGIGDTLAEAAINARKAGAAKTDPVVGYCYTSALKLEVTVDDYGAIHYPAYAKSTRLFGPADSKARIGTFLTK